jgi:hypothetical protein
LLQKNICRNFRDAIGVPFSVPDQSAAGAFTGEISMQTNQRSTVRTLHRAIAPIFKAFCMAAGLLLWAILLLRRRSRYARLADFDEEFK